MIALGTVGLDSLTGCPLVALEDQLGGKIKVAIFDRDGRAPNGQDTVWAVMFRTDRDRMQPYDQHKLERVDEIAAGWFASERRSVTT